MENIEIFFIIGLYTLIIHYSFSKFSFLRDRKIISTHKTFINQNITPPFSGGIIFLITFLIFLSKNNINLITLCSLTFFLGFLSDTNTLKSPNLRFILQILFLIFFIKIMNITIDSIRIEFFDNLLQNEYFKIFFSTFCILILINGTNFIDGLNTLVLGYYILVLYFINLVLGDFSHISFYAESFSILFFVLIILFFFNFFELLYLGDGGSYLLGIFFGILLIDIYNSNNAISPYYIMNLLWYPAYENLFSIIRKISTKYSAFKPDNLHLHQLIYLNLNNFFDKKFTNTKIVNTLSGLLINLFNLFIFYIATLNYSNTKYQLFITIFLLTIYNILYMVLKKNLKNFD
jgi:UDP-N-acetylmuramyl pentapeptide phosphotransferase/UDP-N-acetylglucosamine-1-phosphate transferase